ncbi:MAG: MATE family efflux transporter [Mailhella sp.]|nr:MATE family efflux transporter [Mailhella sp.]
MAQNTQENEMGVKSVGRLLTSYSIPAIIGMVIIALNQVISSIYIGYGIGPTALGAMAVTFPAINLLMAFCQLVAMGCAALCSIELGRGDMRKANAMLGHSVLLEIMASILFGVVFWLFLDPILLFFGASSETLPDAHDFMMPLIVLAPFGFLVLGFNFLTRATGYPKTAMCTALMTSLGIVVFSPIFINWWGWGMRGAALAQVVGQAFSVAWLVLHFARNNALIRFRRGIWRLRLDWMKQILSIGMAPFLINFCACIVVVVLNRALLENGGDLAVGAFGIINRLMMVAGMSVVGLGQGMQPIIGFNFGARKPERVRQTLRYGLIASTLITLTGTLGSFFMPETLVRIFTDHGPLVDVATHGLRIMGAMFVCVGPQIVIGTYFQSMGLAKIASLISMLRQMICLLPLLFILPPFFGLDGVWVCMPLADVMGFAVAAVFLWLSLRAQDNPCRKGDPECTPSPDFLKPRQM